MAYFKEKKYFAKMIRGIINEAANEITAETFYKIAIGDVQIPDIDSWSLKQVRHVLVEIVSVDLVSPNNQNDLGMILGGIDSFIKEQDGQEMPGYNYYS